MPESTSRLRSPLSTYRLQLHAGFTFEQAMEVSDYLRELGVSHAYTSPYLKASPGSTHGYDVVDYSMVNPEIGGEAGRTRWVDSLNTNGLSHIIDVVPNHMGVSTSENRWWNDVLEHGPHSRYAGHFDIEWNDPPRPASRGKVLLPILGDRYSRFLRGDQVSLQFDAERGTFDLLVYGRPLPLTPRSYHVILSAVVGLERLRADDAPASGDALKETLADRCSADDALADRIGAAVGSFNSATDAQGRFERLHRLLEMQHYRLVHWLSTNGEINYRRFFDVPGLAAVRMERQEVFEASHALIRGWLADGSVTGLRIDHPDGLANPAEYFNRLQALGSAKGVYILAEKILGAEENLLSTWPVAGTSGYDFLNQVNGLFVDSAAADRMTQVYESFIGRQVDYRALVIENKKRICDEAMSGELTMLAERLDAIAQEDLDARDYSFVQIRAALRELVASFPVYRSYIAGGAASDEDRLALDEAIKVAKKSMHRTHHDLLDFIRETLLGSSASQQQFAERFQQFTSPVMAKGVEDTTFYQYNRLLSLNEVGGEPERFGVMPHKVHDYFIRRAREWPTAMSTLSTHDTKRSEDVRARLNVLSEIPERWAEQLLKWTALNTPLRKKVQGRLAPDRNDEYAIYQLILGVWPMGEGATAGTDPALVERLVSTVRKSLREAKAHTSWLAPEEEYEEAAIGFVEGLLDVNRSGAFLESLSRFADGLARAGAVNSLAQTTLKLTAPGVPDTYQGTELFDFSLVDPDNRRPVDYEKRRRLLAELPAFCTALADRGPLRLEARPLDLAKLLLHRSLLTLRRAYPDLFLSQDYTPLATQGPRHQNVFAFLRSAGSTRLLVAVPSIVGKRVIDQGAEAFMDEAWRGTRFVSGVDGRWRDALFGREWTLSEGIPSLAELFGGLPVAVLVSAG